MYLLQRFFFTIDHQHVNMVTNEVITNKFIYITLLTAYKKSGNGECKPINSD